MSCTTTSSLSRCRALSHASWHDRHVDDENTATNQGASGRSKSARSSIAGTAYDSGCVGASTRVRLVITTAATTAATAIARPITTCTSTTGVFQHVAGKEESS